MQGTRKLEYLCIIYTLSPTSGCLRAVLKVCYVCRTSNLLCGRTERLEGKEQSRIRISDFSLCLGLWAKAKFLGMALFPPACLCQAQASINPFTLYHSYRRKIISHFNFHLFCWYWDWASLYVYWLYFFYKLACSYWFFIFFI